MTVIFVFNNFDIFTIEFDIEILQNLRSEYYYCLLIRDTKRTVNWTDESRIFVYSFTFNGIMGLFVSSNYKLFLLFFLDFSPDSLKINSKHLIFLEDSYPWL